MALFGSNVPDLCVGTNTSQGDTLELVLYKALITRLITRLQGTDFQVKHLKNNKYYTHSNTALQITE